MYAYLIGTHTYRHTTAFIPLMPYVTLPVHSGECTLPPQFGNFWVKFV